MNNWIERELSEMNFIDEEPAGWISDELLDQVARCEMAQRFYWAVELGVDPLHGDLLGLRPGAAPTLRRAA